jgi:hypothetical protein
MNLALHNKILEDTPQELKRRIHPENLIAILIFIKSRTPLNFKLLGLFAGRIAALQGSDGRIRALLVLRTQYTTPESYEDDYSQESAPLWEIDTQPVGPASILAQRAYPWRRYVQRQVRPYTLGSRRTIIHKIQVTEQATKSKGALLVGGGVR